ncbi:MAG: CPBP family intramembrane glutamic endopeptidase [Thermoanaerobaculia bacterium]|nr:CPBP family intramembrane glutamic endopeptidase [Thermoanaerobaculia bacterium]
MEELLRAAGPVVLAALASLGLDRSMERRGLLPPGFRGVARIARLRRALAAAVMALTLWLGAFAVLGLVGRQPEFDPSQVARSQLFLLHALFALALALWLALGFGGDLRQWAAQLGLRARAPLKELALGTAAGLAAWAVVLGILIALGSLVWALGGADSLPREPPPVVPWMAALPLWLRLALSLSAGVAEETFFRGFLQPRVGIALSSVLFVLAHLSYEQPLMLVGIALLSVIFALLVAWRQSVWAAVAAHTVFDALQLGVMIPWAMRLLEGEGGAGLPPVAAIRCVGEALGFC